MSRAARRTVAIVGGGIGRSHAIEGIVPNGDKFDLLAVCDINPERLEAFAREFKVPRTTTRFVPGAARPSIGFTATTSSEAPWINSSANTPGGRRKTRRTASPG